MTILITGATGFIGKYLCLTLLQQGHDVQALTRSKSSLNHPPRPAFESTVKAHPEAAAKANPKRTTKANP